MSDATQNGWWDRIDRAARAVETWLIVVILGGLILFGGAQIVLRNFFSIGFAWSDGLTRLAVLWLGLLGALAASSRWAADHDGRLGTLVAAAACESSRASARTGSAWVVSAALAWASWGFVSDSREFGDTLLAAAPAWWFQAIMPVAFALMAWQFPHAEREAAARDDATRGAPGVSAVIALALIVVTLLGAPLFAVIGAGALIGFEREGVDLSVVAIEFFGLSETPVLVAIPLFTFAGFLLSAGQAPARLVRLSQALLGWLPGGLAIISLVACALFTAFTGASGVTIIALGALLYPALSQAGYDERFNLGLITSSGSFGSFVCAVAAADPVWHRRRGLGRRSVRRRRAPRHSHDRRARRLLLLAQPQTALRSSPRVLGLGRGKPFGRRAGTYRCRSSCSAASTAATLRYRKPLP